VSNANDVALIRITWQTGQVKRSLAGLLTIVLVACGPNTTVVNDKRTPLFMDIIKRGHVRQPVAGRVERSDSMTAPWCARDVASVWLGTSASALQRFEIAGRCKPASCHCTVLASDLLGESGH
jgi:hypothetical protein